MDEKTITLLAPARDINVAKAAIQAGADAVYIGAPSFGAREKAANSMEDIVQLVRYAHLYHVQVLVTLNTLLTPDERPQAVKIAWDCYRAGVDALIIQDLNLLSEDLPPIRLHASTQCDNRTPEQVLHLQSLGFKRVVLARELSLEEIRNISEAVCQHAVRSASEAVCQRSGLAAEGDPIELEAFIHGALCVSYSGRCYMSERLLGRSANRGCCAQMCRMAYDVLDKNFNEVLDDDGQPIHQRYVLSLQDLDRSLYLKQLIDAGVTTFKIEGRLKDADYVTNIVAYYRQLFDSLTAEGDPTAKRSASDSGLPAKRSQIHHGFVPNPSKTFHRGATAYFMEGRTRPMANWFTPKSTGEKVGVVINNHIVLDEGVTLHNGDGLCIGDQGFYYSGQDLQSFSVSGLSAAGGLSAKRSFSAAVYRNHDSAFLRSLHAERRILVDIVFSETPTGFALTIGEHTATFDYPHEPARNADQALQTIRTQLAKLGDTPYEARDIHINLSQPYFIPIATLNQWRRQLTQNL